MLDMGNFLTDNNTWNSQGKVMAFILSWSILVILMIHFQKMHLSDVRRWADSQGLKEPIQLS